MNSQRPDLIDRRDLWDEAKAYARRMGVVGIGWGRPEVLKDGASLDEVLDAVRSTPGWGPTGPQTIERFAREVKENDFVWTRDSTGAYWLCRIAGNWAYDGSAEARKWDLYNVRPCDWLKRSYRDYEVPGAVVRSFVGRAATFCRVAPESAAVRRATGMLFEQAKHPRRRPPKFSPEDVLSDLLDPIDVEDLVLLLLQERGWLLLPSTRMSATPIYEAALRRRNGDIAVVSVKSGRSNPVPIPELAAAVPGAKVFVYSTHQRYSAPPGQYGATEIKRDQLIDFMGSHPKLLPPRISRWLASSQRASA